MMFHRISKLSRIAATAVAALMFVSACGGDGDAPETSVPTPPETQTPTTVAQPIEGTTVTLLTHDSFNLPEATLEAFTEQTGVTVELLAIGDTGTLVAEAILTKDAPLGDALFGIDNTFLERALDAKIFERYESPALVDVPESFQLDPLHRVTPVDYGDVCINYWKDAVPRVPETLDQLTRAEFDGQLVVQHPETSSPGMAFLLATVAAFGDIDEEGEFIGIGESWEQYWEGLRDNNVSVTAGWEEAYNDEFIAGGGDRSLVVSYGSSPPAEVIYADPPIDTAPTGVLTDSCFRQIEFAGVLAGSDNVAGARALIDFMLSETWQNEVPLNMFVYPVNKNATIPEVFVEHTTAPEQPLMLDPAEIEENREAWTEKWVEIVLR